MTLNKSGEQSVDKATGDDPASESRAKEEFVKALEARKTADDTIASNTSFLDYQKEKMALTLRDSCLSSQKDKMRDLEEKLDANKELLKEQEETIAKQERHLSLQEQRILALEEKFFSLFSASPMAKTGR